MCLRKSQIGLRKNGMIFILILLFMGLSSALYSQSESSPDYDSQILQILDSLVPTLSYPQKTQLSQIFNLSNLQLDQVSKQLTDSKTQTTKLSTDLTREENLENQRLFTDVTIGTVAGVLVGIAGVLILEYKK